MSSSFYSSIFVLFNYISLNLYFIIIPSQKYPLFNLRVKVQDEEMVLCWINKEDPKEEMILYWIKKEDLKEEMALCWIIKEDPKEERVVCWTSKEDSFTNPPGILARNLHQILHPDNTCHFVTSSNSSRDGRFKLSSILLVEHFTFIWFLKP